MSNKTLILTVGLPRSGKSSWAMKQGFPIVNPDSIRLALHGKAFIEETEPIVWTIAKYMVKALFIAGHDKVILDATNLTKKRRDFWKNDKWKRKYVYFDMHHTECINRAIFDNKSYLIDVILRMNDEKELDFEDD